MVERSRPADDGGMTPTTDNKQLVEEFISALFTHGDLTAVDRYLDPDCIDPRHTPRLRDG
jgi:hypothetical protein